MQRRKGKFSSDKQMGTDKITRRKVGEKAAI
jgi:hypothetical protein